MPETLAKLFSAELEGITAKCIEVEVDLNVGLHAFNIVGLADKALSESRERVNSALKNSGAKPPNRENRKITVNLAPADIKKTGAQYDLAIALGYLLASGQIRKFDGRKIMFVGELALDGGVRGINGALNIAEMAAEHGFDSLMVPSVNAREAAVIDKLRIIPVDSLREAIDIIEERASARPLVSTKLAAAKEHSYADFADVRGQQAAKRALTIAAAGGHNLLMIGPPGVGKSLLAQAMVGILPDLTKSEAIEVTKIWSAAGAPHNELISERPFRAPHHTASAVAIVGGGTNPRPGEISLAHRGILFLDELPEFPKNILESLRQPLEAGIVHVARAKNTFIFPARFGLVAAMNPCPCGFFGDPEKECGCGAYEVMRYQKKISGPLLDRIDLQLRVGRIEISELRTRLDASATTSASIKMRVAHARELQSARFADMSMSINSEMRPKDMERLLGLSPTGDKFLKKLEGQSLSPRSFYRLLKTARTIADLENDSAVSEDHLAEAFSYRLRETA